MFIRFNLCIQAVPIIRDFKSCMHRLVFKKIQQQLMLMLTSCGVVLFVSVFTLPALAAGPYSFTYQGRLYQSNGTSPLLDTVSFTLRIYDPAENCLLYEEEHLNFNLGVSNGLFSLPVGTGLTDAKRGANDPGLTMVQIFANAGQEIRAAGSPNCAPGYTPSTGHKRKLRVEVYNTNTTQTTVLTPWQEIVSTPYATVADTLHGKTPADFLQVRTTGGHNLNQSNLESVFTPANYTELMALINGTSTNYMTSSGSNFVPSGNMNFNNQRITDLAAPSNDQDAATKKYVDDLISTVSLPDVGTAGTYTKVTTDSKGRVTSGTTLGAVDIPDIPASKVTSGEFHEDRIPDLDAAKITGGTFADTRIPDLDAAKITTGTLADARIPNLDASKITTGTLHSDRIPATLSGNRTVSGNLSVGGDLSTGGNASIGGTLSTTSHLNVGGNLSTTGNATLGGHLVLPSQSTLHLGVYDDTQEGALETWFNTNTPSAHKGKVWYNSDSDEIKYWDGSSIQVSGGGGGGGAPSGSASGDLSGSYPGPTVARVQGNPVASTSLGASNEGQVYIWNGTQFIASFLGISDIRSTAVGNAQFFPTNCSDSQTLVWSAPTDTMVCTNIGIDWAQVDSTPTTLSGYGITDAIQNAGGIPSIASGTEGTRPGPSVAGRLYVSTDTKKIFRDTGATWEEIAASGGGGGGGGTITEVVAGTGLSGGGTSGAIALNLANTAVVANSYGSATQVATFTVDEQGRLTTAGNTVIEIPSTQVTGLGTMAGESASDYLAKVDNLSGLSNLATARSNLGISSVGENLVTAVNAGAARTSIGAMAAVAPGTSGNVLQSNGTSWTSSALSITGSEFGSQTANRVLASPNGSSGAPSFRALVANDIPNLSWSKITSGTPTTLSGYGITDAIQNAGNTPSIASGTEATRPGPSVAGRLYVATDTKKVFRDTGAAWEEIAANTDSGGTVTSVGSGTGLTGGPITGSGTISIANGGVGATQLASSAVTTAKIASEAVTSAKLANGSVTSAKIANGAVTDAKVTSVNIGKLTNAAGTYLAYRPNNTACTANQVLKWDATNSRWICGADNNSGGTVTSVGSGTGLTGGPITGSGTLSFDTTWGDGRYVRSTGDTMTGNLWFTGATRYIGTSDANQFRIRTNASDRMTILANGNVGVGTTAPEARLHVNGATILNGTTDLPLPVGSTGSRTFRVGYEDANNYSRILSYGSAHSSTPNRLLIDNTANGSNTTGGYIDFRPNANYMLLYPSGGTSGYLRLYAGGSERIRITSNGNVGVGTTSPGSKLHVDGAIRATQLCDTGGANCKTISSGWTNGTVTSVGSGTGLTGGPITGSGTISIASGGVGATQLASSAVTTAKIANGAVTDAKVASINISKLANGSGAYFTYRPNNTACTANQVLKWNATNSRWVCGTDNNSGGSVTSVGSGTGLTGGPITGSGTISIANGGVGATQLASSAVTTVKVANGAITAAKIANGAVTSAKIASGAVTTTELAGSAVTTAKIAGSAVTAAKIANGAVSTAKIANGAVTAAKIGSGCSGGRAHMEVYGSGSVLRQCRGGSVVVIYDSSGVSITPPARYVASNFSDESLKNRIEQIPDPLEKVLQLRGVGFEWSDHEVLDEEVRLTTDIGVIAQDVEKVFPEATAKTKDGFYQVQYHKLIGPIIEAIRELYHRILGQDSEIVGLKEAVISLQEENQQLKESIEALQKSLSIIQEQLEP